MTQRVFQAALAHLATEPGFRERARLEGGAVFGPDLTELERRRLAAVASDRGLDVTITLIKSFRLGKLLTLLPLTRTLLGDKRLAREVALFWQSRPPTSFYLVEEALAFCDHLEERRRLGLRVAYLEEVVAYERAMLELRRVRPDGTRPSPRRVQFRHDPRQLLACLSDGERPRRIPKRPCVLSGALAADGSVEWCVVDAATQ